MPRSAVLIDVERPTARDIRVEDVACGLANLPLFGPRASFFYSLAQHSVDVLEAAVADDLGPRAQAAALHGRSTQVYAFERPEHAAGWARALEVAFGFEHLDPDVRERVAEADRRITLEAGAVLLADCGVGLAGQMGVPSVRLTASGPTRRPMSRQVVEAMFLERHRTIEASTRAG